MASKNALGLGDYGSDSENSSQCNSPQIESEHLCLSGDGKNDEKNEEESKMEVFKEVQCNTSNVVENSNESKYSSPSKPSSPCLLPPEPSGSCNPDTQNKIERFLQLSEEGFNFMSNLRSKKEFGNPYILQKVVDYFGIDDIQSGFPKQIYDPHGYTTEDFYDSLAVQQRKDMENIVANDMEHQQVQQPSTSYPPSSKKRRTKWSQTIKPQPGVNPLMPDISASIAAENQTNN